MVFSIFITIFSALFITVIFTVVVYHTVSTLTKGYIYTDVVDIPKRSTGLLLGAPPYVQDGRRNLFFEQRMDAAALLLHNDVVKVIVASGDNSRMDYNEPLSMQKALIKRGVKAEAIVLDYAGFRTLDSIVRMRRVFQQDNFIIISQRFHLARAIFIARAHKISAIGYATRRMPANYTHIREFAARVLAFFDIYVLHTQPRFLGNIIPINIPL